MPSLKNASQELKTIFLIAFTKELLKNSSQFSEKINEDILKEKVKKIIGRRKEEREEQIKKLRELKKTLLPKNNFGNQIQNHVNQKTRFPISRMTTPSFAPLPPTVSNIHPVPQQIEVDLGKLNPLIKDPTVSSIIVDSPDKNIQVRRGAEKRTTAIVLTIEEIQQIIEAFAQASKIPLDDFYKVVVGNLSLSAVDTRGESPKFIIIKMLPQYHH